MEGEVFDQLDELSKEFYGVFKQHNTSLIYNCSLTNGLEITIPAKSKEFGDIKICLEREEIVVELSDYYHHHFERYSNGDNIKDEKVRKEIIQDTINFIDDVLNDNVLLTVKKKGNKIISSKVTYLDSDDKGYTTIIPLLGLLGIISSEKCEVKFYIWSGKYHKRQEF